MMELATYQKEALKTLQPSADAMYVFTKLIIEAGEAAQPIVKAKYHGKPVDYAYVVDELSDCLWYLTAAADAIGASLEEVAAHNIAKLRKRHGETYNAEFYQEAQ